MFMLYACISLMEPARAETFVLDVGEEMRVELNGGWARIFPDRNSDGWHFLFAAGGNFNLLPMTEDYQVEDFGRIPLTPSTELKDHAIVVCPQGGYLHTASANLTTPNDSAYAYRYDDDFNLLDWSVLEEENIERSHNDMPLACAPQGGVTVFGGLEADALVHNRFFLLDDNAQEASTVDSLDVPHTAGTSLRHIPGSEDIWVLEMSSLPLDNPGELVVNRLDANFESVETHYAQLLPSGYTGHWPQALLRIGDYWMVGFIGWPLDPVWDGHNGDMWVSILDQEWNVLETVQVSHNEPTSPGMRPGLVRRGSKVLASYDKNVQPHLFELDIDLEAFGAAEDDTGGYWDTGSEGSDKQGCGCSSNPTPNALWLPLLGGVLIAFRRNYSTGVSEVQGSSRHNSAPGKSRGVGSASAKASSSVSNSSPVMQ